MDPRLTLSPMTQAHQPALRAIFDQVVLEGSTYAQDEVPSPAEFHTYWCGRGGEQWVALREGQVVGGYTVRANHPGRGAHVATASYLVSERARGAGVGRALGSHSLERARALGFSAMQFNFVVATNAPAVRLWRSLGFEVLARLPGAFRHPTAGRVDALVMFLDLARPRAPEGTQAAGGTLPTVAGIERALEEVRPLLPETPLVHSAMLSRAFEAQVWLKNETVSPIASFKLRGAATALLRRQAQADLAGVVTSSTGNHGQGVAYAAKSIGLTADIFMPEAPNPLKRALVELVGGRVHAVGHDLDAAKELARAHAERHGLAFLDDGEDLDVMQGAGTVGLEVARALDRVDALFVPMGSGTLAAGCAVALKALHPGARVTAVGPAGSAAMVQSFHQRRAVELPAESLADGLVCRVPAQRALQALWAALDDAATVTEQALLAGVRTLVEGCRLLAEPSAAAALAAAWERRASLRGQTVVLIVTGSNITAPLLRRALDGPLLVG